MCLLGGQSGLLCFLETYPGCQSSPSHGASRCCCAASTACLVAARRAGSVASGVKLAGMRACVVTWLSPSVSVRRAPMLRFRKYHLHVSVSAPQQCRSQTYYLKPCSSDPCLSDNVVPGHNCWAARSIYPRCPDVSPNFRVSGAHEKEMAIS